MGGESFETSFERQDIGERSLFSMAFNQSKDGAVESLCGALAGGNQPRPGLSK